MARPPGPREARPEDMLDTGPPIRRVSTRRYDSTITGWPAVAGHDAVG
jgi:hypothetical protein